MVDTFRCLLRNLPSDTVEPFKFPNAKEQSKGLPLVSRQLAVAIGEVATGGGEWERSFHVNKYPRNAGEKQDAGEFVMILGRICENPNKIDGFRFELRKKSAVRLAKTPPLETPPRGRPIRPSPRLLSSLD